MSEEEVKLKEDTQPFTPMRDRVVYNEPPRQSEPRGCGCWLPALIAAFLAVVLILIGAVLPPVNLLQRVFGVSLFGPNYTMLTAQSNAIRSSDNGLTLVVDPNNPGKDFGVALNAQAAGSKPADQSVAAAQAAIPPNLALQSALYSVQTTGTPGSVTLTVALPANAPSTDLLDLYGWNDKTGQWVFLPSHLSAPGSLTATVDKVPSQVALFQAKPPDQPTVLAAVDAAQVLSADVAKLSTIVAPGGMQPTLDGKLTGSLAPGFALNQGYLVMPVVRNYADPRALDTDTVTAILRNSGLRTEHVRQITGFVANNNFSGVFIDYRGLPDDQRANFSAFVQELGASLSGRSLALGVVVPAASNAGGTWNTGAYDWRALGASANYLQINMPLDPGAYAPGADKPVEAMLRWAVGEVSRDKLLLGLSSRSVKQVGTDFAPVGYQEGLAPLGDVKIDAKTTEAGTVLPGDEIRAALNGLKAASGEDTVIKSPFIDYEGKDGAKAARVWLTTPAALRFRMNWTTPFGLGGVAFEDLLAEGQAQGVLQTVLNYKLQMPENQTAAELALRWHIEGKNGMVGEAQTGLNEGLVTTIEAPDGNYAINVDVVSGNNQSPRTGAAVAVFAPTPTPTPIPTATPTPTPTPTATPKPAQATAAPAAQPSGGGSAPVRPGAGSISVGNFEYGGHVTSTASGVAAAAMKRAGMNWMKVQLRYQNGMSPGAAAGLINDAHANGFKVLLAIPGQPSELAAGGAGYVQQYAQFLGGVAGLGPDAIEVWNEMNIDREWPTGQISGAAYADMLRQAYQAIKGANGSVMVISGAPAPTGAEGAYPGQVVNDDHFLRDMVNAGAMQYMDCLGAHYNEGIVGPDQNGGDPRDNYYTRYFNGMLNTYWSISGGQKPICFTELGYLTSEGYGPLPASFGWAANTTVAEQAAWLARAAALASQSGKVRLMIVWNVDFTLYSSDPQGGYAMIRPGGGCPACDAMAAAR
jgi:hypothetical protein